MMQPPIVEARATAKPPAVFIHSDERQQNEIEFTNGDTFRSVSRRLLDAEAIASQSFARFQSYERHSMRAHVRDQRYVKTAAALQRHAYHDAGIQFASVGQIDRNAAAGPQPALSSHDACKAARGLRILIIGEVSAPHSHGAPHLIAR